MNVSSDNEKIQQRMQELIGVLIKNYMRNYVDQAQTTYVTTIDYQIDVGKKYYKINMIDHPGTPSEGRSVHAFVSRQTGAMYKPASWRAPAKIARYNLLDDISYQQCLDRADWAGGYLYLR